jgi:hypothetical protein
MNATSQHRSGDGAPEACPLCRQDNAYAVPEDGIDPYYGGAEGA